MVITTKEVTNLNFLGTKKLRKTTTSNKIHKITLKKLIKFSLLLLSIGAISDILDTV